LRLTLDLHLNPFRWQRSALPGIKDPRWAVTFLLGAYLVLGVTVLGFSRSPIQLAAALFAGMAVDFLLCGILHGRAVFPISAFITCLSLSIIMNFSAGLHFLVLPVFAAIASKYIFTFQGKHLYNPSLFGIVFALVFGDGWISIAPAYQWTGSAETAWLMSITILTAGIMIFAYPGSRKYLALSFLGFFALQLLIRSYIIRFHLPAEALFIGTITSPSFFLFSFFMITDPATSPPGKRMQIITGFALAVLDLAWHLKYSLFTFFYAAFTWATLRFLYLHVSTWLTARASGSLESGEGSRIPALATAGFSNSILARIPFSGFLVVAVFAVPIYAIYSTGSADVRLKETGISFERIPSSHSGLGHAKSSVLEEVDPRLLHIAKWLLSVGDSVAAADVNLDGRQDLFFTQSLKSRQWQAKLHLNKGAYRFEKRAIPDLERWLSNPREHGLPAFAFFFDYDNDRDPDLFVGFGFGRSHLFENRMVPDGDPQFREVRVAWLENNNTVALAANALDFNRDGRLDLLVANTLPPYFKDYEPRQVPFNIFRLPEAEYAGDRRMLHFMHHSWHNANNGGKNHLLLNSGSDFLEADAGLVETRWSLAVGTGDLNQDGFTDIYIANDFGRDDCYLNENGKRFVRQEGSFFEDLGLDTYKGMNTSIGDVDGNGAEDIYVSNVHHPMQAEGSLLWMNETQPGARSFSFKDRAAQRGALNPGRFGWGAAIGDIDMDGRLDIVQANGMVSDKWDKTQNKCIDFWYLNEKLARSPPEIHTYADQWADIRGACIYPDEADRVYINQGNRFADAAEAAGVNHRANTRGVALVDLENRGSLDMIFTDQFGEPILYRNKTPPRPWAGLRLLGNGRTCSSDAVGSRVLVTAAGKTQVREMRLVNGFSAEGDTRMLFGLPEGAKEVLVDVNWCGQERRQYTAALGRYTLLRQHHD
jgi:Na+-translocating ferredoxin:NAD+ oxidoreductase RnfD subunit